MTDVVLFIYKPFGVFLLGIKIHSMIEYIKEVKAEMKNITWPKRQMTISFTIAVIVISVAVAYYLGALDYVFSVGLKQILTN